MPCDALSYRLCQKPLVAALNTAPVSQKPRPDGLSPDAAALRKRTAVSVTLRDQAALLHPGRASMRQSRQPAGPVSDRQARGRGGSTYVSADPARLEHQYPPGGERRRPGHDVRPPP